MKKESKRPLEVIERKANNRKLYTNYLHFRSKLKNKLSFQEYLKRHA